VRERQVNIRFADEEVAWLERLAAHYSLSPGSLVRMLIKTKHDELFPAARVRTHSTLSTQPPKKRT
jgi:hypothetical protein